MIIQLIIGLLLLSLGLYFVIQRDRIVARHHRRNGQAQTTTTWGFLGGLLVIAGTLDIVSSLL